MASRLPVVAEWRSEGRLVSRSTYWPGKQVLAEPGGEWSLFRELEKLGYLFRDQRSPQPSIGLPMVPDLTPAELDAHERRVAEFMRNSNPVRVAAVVAKYPVLSDAALLHRQRREVDLWALDRRRPRPSPRGGARMKDWLTYQHFGVVRFLEKHTVRALHHATPRLLGGGRACVAEVPRLAAIFGAEDAALNAVERVLTEAGLSTNEREAARLRGEGIQVAGPLADAWYRAEGKLRKLGSDRRKVCPTCGVLFDWQRTTAVYCSDTCRAA